MASQGSLAGMEGSQGEWGAEESPVQACLFQPLGMLSILIKGGLAGGAGAT